MWPDEISWWLLHKAKQPVQVPGASWAGHCRQGGAWHVRKRPHRHDGRYFGVGEADAAVLLLLWVLGQIAQQRGQCLQRSPSQASVCAFGVLGGKSLPVLQFASPL